MKKFRKVFYLILAGFTCLSLVACDDKPKDPVEENPEQLPEDNPQEKPEEGKKVSTIKVADSTKRDVFKIGTEFSSQGLKLLVVYEDNTTLDSTAFTVDSSAYKKDIVGDYEIKIITNISGVSKEMSYTVKVVNAEVITTVEAFLAMRRDYIEGVNNKSYYLANDLDLTGVFLEELASNTLTFTGLFDGNRHTLKNIRYDVTGAKLGVMFATVDNATIKNIRFDSITVNGGTNESNAIVCGIINGKTEISNLEFSSCLVKTDGNYTALVASRNMTAAELTFKNITVKNSCKVVGSKYTGVIIGDFITGSKAAIENCDIDVEVVNNGGQLGAVAGRVRGGEIVFRNIVIAAKTSKLNKSGLFFDGSSSATIKFENILIKSAEMKHDKQSSLLDGGGAAVNKTTYENIFAIKGQANCYFGEVLQVLPEQIEEIEGIALTSGWYKDILGLDMEAWEFDVDSIKLKNTSPNRPSVGAVISSISASSEGMKTKYIMGEAFDAEGLVVKARYSDGVEIAIDASKYEIDSSKFKLDATGTFEIVVKIRNTDIKASFNVIVIKLESLEINTMDAKQVYIVGEALNTTGVVVCGVLTDNSKKVIGNAKITSDFNKDIAGRYSVSIAYDGLETKMYYVFVVDSTITNLSCEINVDATFEGLDGALVEGKHTFTTIANALDFIKSINLDAAAKKIINIAAGTYNEKLTIETPNVVLKGAGMETTKITYGAAAGHLKPNMVGTWGTEGSATVTIKSSATGFSASNLSFINSFDYLNDNSVADKQAVALMSQADQSTYYRCGFISHQDTLEPKSGRHYFNECFISGSVDFIFGNNSTCIFEKCEIKSRSRGENQTNGGYITAAQGCNGSAGDGTVAYGFVFIDCKLTAEDGVLDGSVSLGRPWRTDANVTYINCEMGKHISKAEYPGSSQSRFEEMNGDSPQTANFKEFGSKGAGAITSPVIGGTILENVDDYTFVNIFAATNGLVEYGILFDAQGALAALK